MFPKISKLKLSMKAKKKSHFTRLTKCLMPFFSATDSNSYAHTRDIITQELPPCPLDQMNYYFFFISICPHIKIDLTMCAAIAIRNLSMMCYYSNSNKLWFFLKNQYKPEKINRWFEFLSLLVYSLNWNAHFSRLNTSYT